MGFKGNMRFRVEGQGFRVKGFGFGSLGSGFRCFWSPSAGAQGIVLR